MFASLVGRIWGNGDEVAIQEWESEQLLKAQEKIKQVAWFDKIEELKKEVKGNVLTSLDVEAYTENRKNVWNHSVAGFPFVIVQPTANSVVDDSRLALAFIIEHKIPFSLAGGRHSARCMLTDHLILDFSKNNSVNFNKDDKTITFGSGCKLYDLDKVLTGTGFAGVWGTNPDTGIAGLTFGGGFGYLGKQYGFTCDNLIEVEMLLANGEVIVVNDDNEYADLMAGVRGAGSKMGIVLQMKLPVHPIGRCTGGELVTLCPTIASAQSALFNTVKFYSENDDANGIVVLPVGAPVIPQIFVYFGEDGINGAPVKQITQLGGWINVKNDIKEDRDFHTEIQRLSDPHTGAGNKYIGTFVLTSISQDVCDALIDCVRNKPLANGCQAALLLMIFGGKQFDRIADEKSCLPYRSEAKLMVISECNWTGVDPDDIKRNTCREWSRELRKDLKQWLLETPHPTEQDEQPYSKDVYNEACQQRIATLKAKYDPQSIFPAAEIDNTTFNH